MTTSAPGGPDARAGIDRAVRAVVETLGSRGVDLTAAARVRSAGAAAFARPPAHDEALEAQARTAPLPFLGPGDVMNDEKAPAGIVLDGADPPWLLRRLVRATARPAGTFSPPILVVQRDPAELLNGLARLDDDALLREPRLRFFAGPDASAALAAHLGDRLDTSLPAHGARTPGLRAAAPDLMDRLQGAHAAQADEQRRLVAAVDAVYRERDVAFWHRRFTEAERGLRVLIPVSRFSTYVRHAASDLEQALRALGHEARVLTEPDDHTRLSAVSHLRVLAGWTPDLLISINHPRPMFAGTLPANLPLVCWVQDAMLHLFDRKVGTGQGPLDFLVGALPPELFTDFGYPVERRLPTPVVASAVKFHDGPVAAGAERDATCEMAYASHQSETPERMHARLLAAAGAHGPMLQALDEMLPEVQAIVAKAMDEEPSLALLGLARRTLFAATGVPPEPRAEAALYRQWCFPLAERIVRHETLGWAADLAEKTGWRLRLHGRGWDEHERLGAYACGELSHDEALRVSYRTAAVHLHISVQSLAHQRVMECALAGGFPLCRLTASELAMVVNYALAQAARRPTRLVGAVFRRYHAGYVADHPELMRLVALRHRLGLPVTFDCYPVTDVFLDPEHPFPIAEEQCVDWLLGDLAETTFWSPETLEARVRRAIEDRAWRERQSAFTRGRVQSRLTHEAFARRVLDLVRAGTAASGSARPGRSNSGTTPATASSRR